jgi:hypothetical protein
MKKYDSAKIYLKDGLNLASVLNKYPLKEYGFSNLQQLYANSWDWENAYLSYKEYITAKDSLFSEKNRNDITILETNKILNEQEKKNALLEKKNSIQKLELRNNNILIVFFLILIVVVILTAVYFYFQNQKKRK